MSVLIKLFSFDITHYSGGARGVKRGWRSPFNLYSAYTLGNMKLLDHSSESVANEVSLFVITYSKLIKTILLVIINTQILFAAYYVLIEQNIPKKFTLFI